MSLPAQVTIFSLTGADVPYGKPCIVQTAHWSHELFVYYILISSNYTSKF